MMAVSVIIMMMMAMIKISKKNPVACKIRIIPMIRRMRMAKMMRMTRVVSEIFTQGSFTRPLQKLLPTGLAAYTGLRLRVLMMMMMMMILIDIDDFNNCGDDNDDADDNEYGRLYFS